MPAAHPNSFKARKTLKVGARSYTYWSLKAVEKEVGDLSRLPFSLRILMENLVRCEDDTTVKKEDIAAFADWVKNGGKSTKEINFRCARAAPQTVSRAINAPISPSNGRCIGAIWHSGHCSASADCLTPCMPLFCLPLRQPALQE